MNIILFDDPALRVKLFPFTITRPVALIRTGILTIAEKWAKHLQASVSFSTPDFLQKKFPVVLTLDNLWINGAVCPDPVLVAKIQKLQPGQGLIQKNKVIALRTPEDEIPEVITSPMMEISEPITIIDEVWKIFQCNGEQIRADFELITANRKSARIKDPHTRIYSEQNIFVEEGVYIRAAILNAEDGPIYLGKNSIVQEGAIIKGPFALGESGHVNMGGKMRGDVTVGPFSKIGGEVSTSVVFAYSNKAHDGFLGCSVLGDWCNLGADTNNSNLRNNYGTVKLWSYDKREMVKTSQQFIGLMMGDHSKSGINTMFNTGTVVGVSANIFGGGFPPNFIPSFSWGGAEGLTTFRLTQALETAARVMDRKKKELSEVDKEILRVAFEMDAQWRTPQK
jgi:UDP-N-acetylglucosamine diphosphorylase/glucosamine-1-phosphate N-acetyltransferase